MTVMDRILGGADILFGDPTHWPRWLRRTSLITAPLFFPLWVGAMVAFLVVLGVALIIIWPVMLVIDGLDGLSDYWSRP